MATAIPENHAAFSLGDVADACAGRAVGDLKLSATGVTTDTRAALRGKVFVALRGERFDGHRFLTQALQQGAQFVVAEELPEGVPGVEVASCLDALGQLARLHRQRWGGRVIAVAGSAGKTTTRSITGALLRQLLGPQLHLSAGNLNNRIGVPMVLFGLTSAHTTALLEVGTNQTGEVPALAEVSAPDISVLTLIDLEHTEGLGDIDAIEAEEAAIFHGNTQLAVGNGDDARVRERIRQRTGDGLLYGFDSGCDYRILEATLTPEVTTRLVVERPTGDTLRLESPFVGVPGALATTAAIAVGEALAGRALEAAWIEAALNRPEAREPGRLQPRWLKDGCLMLDDTYNANPASVRAALALAGEAARLRSSAVHVVLGEMRELGPWSVTEHEKLRSFVAAIHPASVTGISGDARHCLPVDVGASRFEGAEAQKAAELPKSVEFFESAADAASHVEQRVQPGDVVLVKASRGVRAELVVDALVKARGALR